MASVEGGIVSKSACELSLVTQTATTATTTTLPRRGAQQGVKVGRPLGLPFAHWRGEGDHGCRRFLAGGRSAHFSSGH